MKDALGHGSNGRGGLTPVQQENAPFKSRLGKRAGHSYLDPNDPRAKQVYNRGAMRDANALSGNSKRNASKADDTAQRVLNGLHSGQINNLPKLQRRHYENIAAAISASPEHRARVSEYADKLATTNPQFNRQRFIEAASGKKK